MSEYSAEEKKAYSFGVKMGREMGRSAQMLLDAERVRRCAESLGHITRAQLLALADEIERGAL